MGLDMYLSKRTYVKSWGHETPEEKVRVIVKKGENNHPTIKPERVAYVIEEMAYWRKFNALHDWFVRNCQDGVDDCRDAFVSYELLQELLERLKEISNDHSKAPELLPTKQGFFFGSTDYDEYYFSDVEETIKVLEEILTENSGDFYYASSW